jgi:hypothetical protein
LTQVSIKVLNEVITFYFSPDEIHVAFSSCLKTHPRKVFVAIMVTFLKKPQGFSSKYYGTKARHSPNLNMVQLVFFRRLINGSQLLH